MLSFKTFFNSNNITYEYIKPGQIEEVIKFFQDEPEFNIVSKDTIREILIDKSNFRKSFIALSQKKIVGSILVGHDEHRNNKKYREFVILRVSPEFRNKDIAETLLRKAESDAMNNSVDVINVEVFEKLKTHNFWKKYGYKLINIVPTEVQDVYLYSKKL